MSFRAFFALGMFLFGTTFIWMTPAFAGRTPAPTGTTWTITNVLALATVVGFSVAAWGVWKNTGWWQTAAVVSAIVGLIAVAPFFFGLRQSGIPMDLGIGINIVLHAGGSAIVLALILVPVLNDWLMHRF